MLEFLARNERRFIATSVDGTIDMMVRIAGSEVDATKIEEWISRHVH